MKTEIKVRHTLQMGHRLHALPGKCQQIHGHTWVVILGISGKPDKDGIIIDYAEVKKRWRVWLDETFDHRLCLDKRDPLLTAVKGSSADLRNHQDDRYPGHVQVPFHPTVENLAAHWAAFAEVIFGSRYTYTVEVWEGDNNCAIVTTE